MKNIRLLVALLCFSVSLFSQVTHSRGTKYSNAKQKTSVDKIPLMNDNGKLNFWISPEDFKEALNLAEFTDIPNRITKETICIESALRNETVSFLNVAWGDTIDEINSREFEFYRVNHGVDTPLRHVLKYTSEDITNSSDIEGMMQRLYDVYISNGIYTTETLSPISEWGYRIIEDDTLDAISEFDTFLSEDRTTVSALYCLVFLIPKGIQGNITYISDYGYHNDVRTMHTYNLEVNYKALGSTTVNGSMIKELDKEGNILSTSFEQEGTAINYTPTYTLGSCKVTNTSEIINEGDGTSLYLTEDKASDLYLSLDSDGLLILENSDILDVEVEPTGKVAVTREYLEGLLNPTRIFVSDSDFGGTFSNFTSSSTSWVRLNYYKIGNEVFVNGLVKGGINGDLLFNLPEGYRPVNPELFGCFTSNNTVVRFTVWVDGNVTINGTPGTDYTKVSLSFLTN